ncbi:hypothetical protein SBV1_650018 [Verrucomicrobia bacterium]|nr:hypothetical protein SBV1_650018 [Verrucomicrobiota bacterium]
MTVAAPGESPYFCQLIFLPRRPFPIRGELVRRARSDAPYLDPPHQRPSAFISGSNFRPYDFIPHPLRFTFDPSLPGG